MLHYGEPRTESVRPDDARLATGNSASRIDGGQAHAALEESHQSHQASHVHPSHENQAHTARATGPGLTEVWDARLV